MELKDLYNIFLEFDEKEPFPKIKINNTENLFFSFNHVVDYCGRNNNPNFKKDFEKLFTFSSKIHLNKICLFPDKLYIFDNDFNIIHYGDDIEINENYIFNEKDKEIYKNFKNPEIKSQFFLKIFNKIIDVEINEEALFYFKLKYNIDFLNT